MSNTRRGLCVCYAVIALLALYGTWSQNLYYFGELSLTNTIGAFGAFVVDTTVNPASRSIGIDISLLVLAAVIWMVHEARKVGIRFVWVYIVLAFIIAVSVTFPLFLIAREIKLAARRDAAADTGSPTAGDYVGLIVVSGVVLWLSWFIGSQH